MKSKTLGIIFTVVIGAALVLIGCGSGSSPSPVSIQKQDGYYNVSLDYSNTSHREMGKQYALAIRQAFPGYETTLKHSLQITYSYLEQASPAPTWQDLINRAKTIFNNLDPDYQAEILGMQDVFNYGVNNVNSPLLSKDEFLVYLLGPDVMRAVACSGSAAFGNLTLSRKTIVGRNADALTEGKETFGQLQAITTFKNGNKSISTIGTLGFLGAISVFNKNRMFGAILDSTTGVPYPGNLSNVRSYAFDLRYAFENFTGLGEVESYLGCSSGTSCKSYAYNHNILLADETHAGALENNSQPSTGNRTIRWYDSALSTDGTDQDWRRLGSVIPNSFAVVNDYRLVGNPFTNLHDNVNRWLSYKACFLNALGFTSDTRCSAIERRTNIGLAEMKKIMGYPGPGSTGKQDDGAIFISEALDPNVPNAYYATMQSIVMDMNTMELWVYLANSDSKYLPKTPDGLWKLIPNPIY